MEIKDKIKQALVKQLKNKRADTDYFLSLVDDYLWYWQQEKDMQDDIKDRGRIYNSMSAAGKEFEKENPSIKSALLYNKQKLAILKDLELNTRNVVADDGDEL